MSDTERMLHSDLDSVLSKVLDREYNMSLLDIPAVMDKVSFNQFVRFKRIRLYRVGQKSLSI